MTSEATDGSISQILTTGVTSAMPTDSYSLALGKEWLSLFRRVSGVIPRGRLSFTIQLSIILRTSVFLRCCKTSVGKAYEAGFAGKSDLLRLINAIIWQINVEKTITSRGRIRWKVTEFKMHGKRIAYGIGQGFLIPAGTYYTAATSEAPGRNRP